MENPSDLLPILEKNAEKHPVLAKKEHQDQLIAFYSLILEENRIQNLTRITEAEEFFDKNIRDALELRNSKIDLAGKTALEVGSGGGLPGVLLGILQSEPKTELILTDSEKKKAQFVHKAVDELQLPGVRVYGERSEKVLKKESSAEVVFARAVGSLSKIYALIRPCSTWNRLVLFKGKRWSEEWETFQASRHSKELKIDQLHEYKTDADDAERKIISLARVPRGTS